MSARSRLALVALLVLVGCDAATVSTGDDARPSDPVTRTFVAEAGADVRFLPLRWDAGGAIAVDAGLVRAVSTALASGEHALSTISEGQPLLRVVGLLDGQPLGVVVADAPGTAGSPGGSTLAGPTSFHWHKVCRGDTCAEVVEYDYDLTEPDGDGTTEWTRPGHAPLTVDRVRFEFEAPRGAARASAAPAVVTVTSPEPLRISP